MTKTAVAALALAFVTTVVPASAQFKNGSQTVLLNLPRVSQRAVLTQRIGLTDVTIVYHRPLVNGRTIFGDTVPYGRVWRAGANDNTTIEFTDPVSIGGHTLPAGPLWPAHDSGQDGMDRHLLEELDVLGQLLVRPEGRCAARHRQAGREPLPRSAHVRIQQRVIGPSDHRAPVGRGRGSFRGDSRYEGDYA